MDLKGYKELKEAYAQIEENRNANAAALAAAVGGGANSTCCPHIPTSSRNKIEVTPMRILIVVLACVYVAAPRPHSPPVFFLAIVI